MAQAATEAAATGEEVAVPSLTTETNEVVAQPGGTFKLEAHREPVRTDINGDWEPIDTSLEVAADGSISPRAITIAVEFGAGGSNEMVTAGAGDHSIAFTWDDGTLPDPVVSGSEVTYPGVRPDVDLVFTAHPDGFTHALVVKTPAAAQALHANPAEITGTSAGLDLSLTPQGALVAESADADVTLVSAPPVAWDSSGSGTGDDHPDAQSSGTGVVHELEPAVIDEPEASTKTGQESSVSIEVAPPAAALADPETVYPLFLDPDITGKGNTHYLTVHSKGWDYYDAANQVMRVGYCGWAECNNSTQGNARSFFSFQIDPLKVAGTDPEIYDAYVRAKQVWSADSAAQPVNLTKARPFTAGTNYPGPVGERLQQIASADGRNGQNPDWLKFDNGNVTQYLQDRANAEDDWVQFSLSAPAEGDKYLWKKFSNDTQLTVIYGFPPTINSYTNTGVVTCGATVYSRGDMTTQASATEVGTKKAGLHYLFEIFQSDLTTLFSRRPYAWESAASYNWVGIPEGNYAWRVRVGQPIAAGSNVHTERASPTANRRFTVDRTPPKDVTISSDDFPEDYWGKAPGTGGTFTITIPNAEASAIGYSFNNALPVLHDNVCIPTTSGFVQRPANHGTITIPATNLTAGVPNTLSVYGFDLAHNKTKTTTYTFYPSPASADGTPTHHRIDAEASDAVTSPDPSAPVTFDGATTAPGPGKYLTMTASAPGSYAETRFTPVKSGYYALGAMLGTCSTCAKATFTVEGAQSFTATPVDTSTGPGGPTGTKYARLGGYELTAGTAYKIRIKFPDASPDTPSTVKLDYLNASLIRAGTYDSLAAAFNNDGIVAEGSAMPVGIEPPRLGPPGEPRRSFSKEALAAAGVVPGQPLAVTFDNNGTPATATFNIPAEGSGGADNAIAAGQTIALPDVTADYIDLLVTASCGVLAPSQQRQFDIRHRPAPGTDPAPADGGEVRQYGIPYPVPEWRTRDAELSPATPAITVDRFVSGSPATAVASPADLYVIELKIQAGVAGLPLKTITLPSTGATLTSTASGCDQPRLHVFAMTTRDN
ncbi:hypothetical protein ACFJIY_11230 [Pimelobacter simplex]|uniref:hypothetical protein n=1 Tax=Nocardioides simplex TaxID=2045 RepID=UPI003672A32C